jgi:thymidylate kinase
MFTVALIGPDGAGKTTISRHLEDSPELRVKNLYMGVNLHSSNYMLPTTFLIHYMKRLFGAKPDTGGPPDQGRRSPRPRNLAKRFALSIKSGIYLIFQISEEWFRLAIAWYYWYFGGYIILFDRHFFCDYYAYDIVTNHRRQLGNRIHGFVLEHVYPKPDLVIYLDAPAEVLFARKGEGALATLERRRKEYLQLREVVGNFEVVDATQSIDSVTRQVGELIDSYYRTKHSKSSSMHGAHSRAGTNGTPS